MLDVKNLSFYRVAQTFISALIVVSSLHMIFSPRFSTWSIDEIKKNLPKIFSINLILVLPIVLVINLYGEQLITFIYGKTYMYSYELLKIFSLLLIINCFSYFTTVFDMKGRSEYTAIVSSVMLISNTILDVFLISIYGVIGAIYATLISWFLSLIVATFIFIKKF